MAKIAIMGFGTVGSGVLEVCRRNAASIARRAGEPVEVKYILDVRDFSSSPDAALFTNSIDTILADPEVKVVVETIGGTRFAYPYVRQCLESGRSVCTSNKEMVATYGAELLALAKEHNVAFLFEASVGGGTPIITPMHQCLVANHISQIQGIVNGTTNFMLTKMKRENMGFDEALKIAQQLGYAETKDPGDDVDGRDACRKIAILASLACGHHVYPDNIPARGIRDITVADIQAAEKLDSAIKLIAWYNEGENGQMAAGVEPMLVSNANQLADVDDVFNAVLMKGDMLGDVVFYGKGAGKLPTASAVVADVIDALKEGVHVHDSLFWKPAPKLEGQLKDEAVYPWYIRVSGVSAALLPNVAGAGHTVFEADGQAAYLIDAATAAQILEQMGYDEHTITLARIAGYLHDIGNCVNRASHAQTGAIMAFQILNRLEMDPADIAQVICAIGNHDEGTGTAVTPVSAALILADKSDVRRSRVRAVRTVATDIHDRVNYAVTDHTLKINTEKKVISLNLQIDTDICSMYEYFEIFLQRMLMCRGAADMLGATFKLTANGAKVL